MNEKELTFYDECVNLITTFSDATEIANILKEIKTLIDALKSNDLHTVESRTKMVMSSFDFEREGIIIQYRNKRHINTVIRIRSDCIYIIGRLILLAFKKIAEHELEKQLNLSNDLSIIYMTLKCALEIKKLRE